MLVTSFLCFRPVGATLQQRLGFSPWWLLLLWSQALEHVASGVGAQGLAVEAHGAWLLHSTWDLPRPETDPVAPSIGRWTLPQDHQGSPALCTLNYTWTACVCVCISRLPERVLADPTPDLWPLLLWAQMEGRCCDFRTEGTNYSFCFFFSFFPSSFFKETRF